MLYVPVTQLDMVAKYIGPKEDSRVKLNRLGSGDWQKAKARVKTSVKDIAKELIELYSQRMKAKGYAFSADNEWQRDFELSFEYDETPDQLRCCEEIKHDMMRSSPMDRLLCGDVGFGKQRLHSVPLLSVLQIQSNAHCSAPQQFSHGSIIRR